MVPVGWGSLPVHGPVLWTVDCQCAFSGVSVWAPSHGIPLLGYLYGKLVLASSEAMAIKSV